MTGRKQTRTEELTVRTDKNCTQLRVKRGYDERVEGWTLTCEGSKQCVSGEYRHIAEEISALCADQKIGFIHDQTDNRLIRIQYSMNVPKYARNTFDNMVLMHNRIVEARSALEEGR
jgi:hypothetical protein